MPARWLAGTRCRGTERRASPVPVAPLTRTGARSHVFHEPMSFRFNSAVSGSPGSGSESSDGRLLVDGRTSEGGGVVCPPWQAVTPRLLGALTMTDVTEASHSVSLSLTVAAVSGCGPVASCACCCWWCE